MIKPDSNVLKKHIGLTAAGVTLQILGNACLFAATVLLMKDISTQIKQVLIQELSREQ